MKRSILVLTVVSLLLTACGSQPAPTPTLVPRPPTRQPTATPRPTHTPAPTLTPVTAELSDELAELIEWTYGAGVFVLGEVQLVQQAAQRMLAEEFDELEVLAAQFGLLAVLESVSEAAEEIDPPAILESFWDDVVGLHHDAMDAFESWLGEETDAAQMLQDITPIVTQLEELVSDAEIALAAEYGFDGTELADVRQEALGALPDVFDVEDLQPTELPEGAAQVLHSFSYEQYEWYHIIGEVENTLDTPIGWVKIVATLYDSAGEVVGTGFTYSEMDVIAPRGRSPFNIGIDEYGEVDSYELQVEADHGELGRQDLLVGSHDAYEEYDWLHIRGEVQNTGDTDADWVKVVATLYDGAGIVVGMGYTFTELDVVPAGGTSPFDMVVDWWEGYEYYELQVEGD